ncbi:Lanosterol synthase erg7A [Lithohypha guttulata]|uniref:Lanosterol synthase erg7A n=1 Tax=Lithohypha guttulata TaxID=1690604 RepID=UPI002DE0DAB6|nr:hypothetical protein LTR51_005992 [Lithohypha guttulata]
MNGHASGQLNGHAQSSAANEQKMDYSKWRIKDENGRHTWHYLDSEEQIRQWPQDVSTKYFLGLPTEQPDLRPATRPSESIDNCLTFYSKLQMPSGHWACEYGGPLFLLPGLVITRYVCDVPTRPADAQAIKNYLFARQNKDGGWGLHVEGRSSVFGTAMNYTTIRLLGGSAEDPRMIRARGKLHELGGAVNGPHWAKFWLSLLGVMDWEIVNPVPPELWLLPDWVPIAPWRWWIHIRQVFLPMSFIWSRRYSKPLTPLTRALREELYTRPVDEINFASHRNSISPADNYHPKSWVLNVINFLLVWVWIPLLRTASIVEKAEAWTWKLVQMEDENTDYACLAPVNAPMNTVVCYLKEGPDSYSFRRHVERLNDYVWMNHEGMLMNGTNGVQVWDTSFTILAMAEAGVADNPKWRPMLTRALAFLDAHQIREEVKDREKCYRQQRKGAWPFSTATQGYTVSDCTSEGLRGTLLCQKVYNYPQLISDERLKDAVDVLLTMQNAHSGGFASYEPQRGSEYMEFLNAAEVFGRIMVEYDYPECTTAVVTVLTLFQKFFPDYRSDEISHAKKRALKYIHDAQRADGSWYGSWGICFTYAAMFALESLASQGMTYSNSDASRRGCEFLISHLHSDGSGGWGESYTSCEDKVYRHHGEKSQVVQTAWACIALLAADYPDKEPVKKALQMIMSRQQSNGEWLQEAIEGVFNCSCMITYPNYKFYFPVRAMGMYVKKWGDEELLKR